LTAISLETLGNAKSRESRVSHAETIPVASFISVSSRPGARGLIGSARVLRALSSFGLVAAVLAISQLAAANGRFPRAERLLEDPRDSSHLILGGTFGMLLTDDAGGTWRHVCEASFAEAGLQTDPVIALAPDGAVLAGIYASVARSASSACDFQKTLGMNNREAVPDFTLSASVPGHALGLLVKLLEDGSSENWLYGSSDGGQSWSELGEKLPSSIGTVATVEIAPSDDARVYVSGLDPDGAGVLLRSNDGGKTFDAFAVPTDASQQEMPYIAGVDATNPDVIYLRTDEWLYDPTLQVANANDALLYSDDAGAHFTELLRRPGKLFGFAFSPDNTALLVGYGDPVESGGGRLTDARALGIYRAQKGSSDFEQRYTGSIGCLTWTAQGVYACTLEAETGFSLALAANADFALAKSTAFTPLLRLKDVVGPLDCPAASSGSICKAYWPSTCESWGRKDCEAPTKAPEQPTPRGVAGGGCSCRSANPNSGSAGAWLVLACMALALRRRHLSPRCH
jgi:MYXO-CTERM domain-containing protein